MLDRSPNLSQQGAAQPQTDVQHFEYMRRYVEDEALANKPRAVTEGLAQSTRCTYCFTIYAESMHQFQVSQHELPSLGSSSVCQL